MKRDRNQGTIRFSKMSGTGNDFIVIDNINSTYSVDWKAFAQRYCTRKTSVGADGIIILEPSEKADFTFRIFNADGSEAEMCGNGARCAAAFAHEHMIAGPDMRFNTMAGMLEAKVADGEVSLKMTDPSDIKNDIKLTIDKDHLKAYFINTGVPHTIVFTDRIEDVDVSRTGSGLRNHPYFEPAGTNVDFVQVMDKGHILARTYERGVEEETLACGTGAVASAIISAYTDKVDNRPVRVSMPGGDLRIDFQSRDGSYRNVWLIGEADTVYTGEIRP